MFITGPSVIAQVTGEQVTAEDLGGADSHMTRSGVTHFVVDDDQQAILVAQKLLSFLPQNNTEDPPVVDPNHVVEPDPELADIVPVKGKKGYDVREVIARIVDWSDFLEVQAGYAPNIVVGFARITGRTVGIVANQPMVYSGVLDINASDKASRVRALLQRLQHPAADPGRRARLPPGRRPGAQRDHPARREAAVRLLRGHRPEGDRRAAQGLRRCLRRDVLQGPRRRPGLRLAHRRDRGDGGRGCRRDRVQARDRGGRGPCGQAPELIEEYRSTFSTPYVAASRGLVDDIIDPARTREQVARALEMLIAKRDIRPAKKHGLGPT